jgi:hypothetical protein
MLNHTTPASLRIPIAVTDKYMPEGIIAFAGFQQMQHLQAVFPLCVPVLD